MGELKQKLATMSPEKRLYTLETLPTHFGEAGQFERLYRLLTDFDFIEAKLEALGVQALIQDYEFVGNITPCPFQEKLGDELPAPAKTLTLIEETMRLSAHILAADKTQLAGQLWGRLMAFELLGIQALLAQVKQQNKPWLRPLTSSFTPPGTPLRRTLNGHTDWVDAVAISPDGQQVVSASSDNTLKVWDLQKDMEKCTLTGHTDLVNAVAVSPDGQQVVSASSDNTLKVWDLDKGVEQFILTGHTDWVSAVTISPDGQQIVSASRDNTLKVWDLDKGVEQFTLTGHTDWVSAVAISPDGQQVVSASRDKTLKVWDLDKGVEKFSLTGHTTWVNAVAISPDGQ
ncbi:MAG: hypothetical protein RIG66_20630, partial [Coleofasciculus sp. E2-BRE-01]